MYICTTYSAIIFHYLILIFSPVESSIENNVLTLFCEGRIDSNCSKQTGKDMEEIIEKHDVSHSDTTIVFDFERLEYISSAGLREFLMLAKKYKKIKIVNASAGVYDIFDTTGFSKIIHITKKLREVSIAGCPIVGQGANGIVYRLDRDTIIKVYNSLHTENSIRASLETAKKLLISGIPVAISYDVVKVGDAYGAVFEMLDTDTMGQFIAKNPERLEEYAIKSAHFLRELHHTELPQGILPDAREMCNHWITNTDGFLSPEERTILHTLCDNTPFRSTFIHGDFHCGNVMVQDGDLTLIDIDEAACGDPAFDFGMMHLTFQLAVNLLPGDRIAKIMAITKEQITRFWTIFEKTYYQDLSPTELVKAKDRNEMYGLIKILNIFSLDPSMPQDQKEHTCLLLKDRLFQLVNVYNGQKDR